MSGDPVPLRIGSGAILAVALAIVTVTDLRARRIPDRVTAPAALALLVVRAVAAPGSVPAGVLWALALGVPLAALALRAPRALGLGDAKLAAVLGAGLGPLGPVALLAGCVLAALAGVFLAVRRGLRAARSATLPLAPFLAAGALLAWGSAWR